METRLEIFGVGDALRQAHLNGVGPVLRWLCETPLKFVCLPGVFYRRRKGDFDAAEIAGIPVMPWYCKVSVPPQHMPDGRNYMSGIYIKSPVCILKSDDGAEVVGLRFTPCLFSKKPLPLFFLLQRRGGRTEFELALLRRYLVRRRSDEQFLTWSHDDRTFSDEMVALDDAFDPSTDLGPIEHSLIHGVTVGDVLEQVAAGAGTSISRPERAWMQPPPEKTFEDACRFHFDKSLRWLLGMYHPWAGTYLSMRGRNRDVAVGGVILPAYNTLASDFYQLTKHYSSDKRISGFSKSACRLHLRPGAYIETPGGAVVFRNTARLAPNRRSVDFFDHLGVGLAGYPGGQATVLRSLAERWAQGDRNPKVREVAQAAAKWLRMAQRDDGSWHRTYKGPAYLDPGEAQTPSPGACAEGATALLTVYKAFGGHENLKAAERAMDHLNGMLSDSMVLTGYFRDCSPDEAEAASGLFIAMMNLQGFRLLGEQKCLRDAKTALHYCLGWHRWWIDAGMDSIQHSFTPRTATCQTTWAAHAYYDYGMATGEAFWKDASERSIACLAYDDPYPGYGDGVYSDEELRPHSVGFDCSYSASAILRFTMRVLQKEMECGKLVLPQHACVFPEDIRPPSLASDILRLMFAASSRLGRIVKRRKGERP